MHNVLFQKKKKKMQNVTFGRAEGTKYEEDCGKQMWHGDTAQKSVTGSHFQILLNIIFPNSNFGNSRLFFLGSLSSASFSLSPHFFDR